MADYAKERAVARGVAERAGEIMLKYFRAPDVATHKSDGSPVTLADIAINRMVIEELSKHFSDTIVGEEESTGEYVGGRGWFCDPIDGTKAYVWGVPTAMFSLGLVVDGEPVLGVAYDPFLSLRYDAVKGEGSFCNEKRIHVSQRTLSEGYTAITSSVEKIVRDQQHIAELRKKNARLAAFSGAVYKMCLVAQGAFVGYFEKDVHAHDTAAGHVIVEEAGGKVTDFNGERLIYGTVSGAVFSNGVVHDELLASIHV